MAMPTTLAETGIKPRPDFTQLRRALLRDSTPEYVPLYELFADLPVQEALIGHPLATRADTVEFYYRAGYDYVPAWPTLSLPQGDLKDTRKGYPISDWRSFEAYPWPKPSDIGFAEYEAVIPRLPDGMGIIAQTGGIFEVAEGLCGYAGLCFLLRDDRELVQAIFDRLGALYTAMYSGMASIPEVGAVVISDDLGFKTQTLVSPEDLRQFVFPWHRKLAEIAHREGKPCILHSCGQLAAVMPDLIEDVGIDAKHSFEDAILPVTEAKRLYGDRIALLGGFDVDRLCRSDEREIREHVDLLLDTCGAGGGYALGTGNSVAKFIPLPHYLTMLEQWAVARSQYHAPTADHYPLATSHNPLSSRQRVEAALRHQEPDRTPIFEYVLLAPLADELLGRPYGGDPAHWPGLLGELGFEAAVRRVAGDRLDLAEMLGHDMLYVYSTGGRTPPTSDPADSPELPEDPVERLRLRNQANAEAEVQPSDDSLLIYSVLQEEMERRGLDLPILGPAYAHGVWTDVDLMQTMLLDPEVAHRHFALATRRALGWVESYAALGITQFGVGGDMAGTRPLISPKAYRDFIMPEVRTVSRRVHELGGWAVNASDGDLWPVIEDFLVGCEVDAYLEIDLHAGMDLGRLKAAYGDRITFYGNLDPGITLSFATPEEVWQHTVECLEKGMGRGGHILCASNAITASVPMANYLAVVAAYRDVFGLPPFALK